MAPAKTCPQCGRPLTPDAPEGLCRACLLQGGLGESGLGYPSAATRWTPPTAGELAARFPELEIVRIVGRGGMGAVYKARQKNLERYVALKILPTQMAADPNFAGRFVQEAQAMARLNHPHIVAIHEFGQRDGLYFFLMEFVDGMSLRSLLDTGHVAPREALAIVPQICEALQYAHDQGIVHRDIKPENILLSKQGQVKIADFGLAKLVGKAARQDASGEGASWRAGTAPGMTSPAGTPAYMAPEQLERPSEVDHRADIYALGVVFYQMLTGELPPKQLEPPSHKVQIDVRLDEIVLRALESSPDLRYQNATQFKTEIETVISSPPAPAVPPPVAVSLPDDAGRSARGLPSAAPPPAANPRPFVLNDRLALAIAGALAALVLLVFAVEFLGRSPREPATGPPSATAGQTANATPPVAEPPRPATGVVEAVTPPPPNGPPGPAPFPASAVTFKGADLDWENFENGCTISKDAGRFHITGTTIASGWGHTNGIRTTTEFGEGDFTVSVDFKQPLFSSNGNKLTCLRISSDDGHMVALLCQPDSYQLQRWTPRAFAGGIRSFGDEQTTFHRLTLSYQTASQLLSGWVDNKFVGSIAATLGGKRKIWLDANSEAAGSQIDVYFENLIMQVEGGRAGPGQTPVPPAGGTPVAARLQFYLQRPDGDTTTPFFQRPNPWQPSRALQLLAAPVLDESALADAAFDPNPTDANPDPVAGSPTIHVFLTPAGAAAYARLPRDVEDQGHQHEERTPLYALLDGTPMVVDRQQSAKNPGHLYLHLPAPTSRAAAEQMVAKLKTLANVSPSAPPVHSADVLLTELPADARPTSDGWDAVTQPKADAWLEDHVNAHGRHFQTEATVSAVNVKRISPQGRLDQTLRWDMELTLERIPFDLGPAHVKLKLDSYSLIDPNESQVPLHLGPSVVTLSGGEDLARRVGALKAGDRIMLDGVISKASVWQKSPPEFQILLSDPHLLVSSGISTAPSATAPAPAPASAP